MSKAPKEIRGSKFLKFLLHYGGPRLCYFLAFFPIVSVYLTARGKRRLMKDFYRRLGLTGVTPFANYWLFGVSLIDRLAMLEGQYRGKVLDPELQTRPKLKPGIFLGSHYGDWFLSGIVFADQERVKLGLVMRTDVTPEFQKQLEGLGQHDVSIIDASVPGPGFVLAIKSLIDQGGYVCFLGDRVYGNSQRVAKRSFLGQDASWIRAPYDVARILSVPIYFFSTQKQGFGPRADYVFGMETIWDGVEAVDPETLLERFVRLLEQKVRSDPRHWFNFIDFWGQGETSQADAPKGAPALVNH